MPMPYSWTILWPGLPQLWLRGQWRGIGVAVLFSLLVNTLLLTTFLWPRIIGTGAAVVVFNIVGWFIVLCFWGASAVTSRRLLPRLQPGALERGDDALFLRAQHEYLQGHWYDAEQLLSRLLQESPQDADAHLLLASLYRHTRRYEESQQRLNLLSLLNGGGKWLFEVAEERRRIANAVEQATGQERESLDDAAASKAA